MLRLRREAFLPAFRHLRRPGPMDLSAVHSAPFGRLDRRMCTAASGRSEIILNLDFAAIDDPCLRRVRFLSVPARTVPLSHRQGTGQWDSFPDNAQLMPPHAYAQPTRHLQRAACRPTKR